MNTNQNFAESLNRLIENQVNAGSNPDIKRVEVINNGRVFIISEEKTEIINNDQVITKISRELDSQGRVLSENPEHLVITDCGCKLNSNYQVAYRCRCNKILCEAHSFQSDKHSFCKDRKAISCFYFGRIHQIYSFIRKAITFFLSQTLGLTFESNTDNQKEVFKPEQNDVTPVILNTKQRIPFNQDNYINYE